MGRRVIFFIFVYRLENISEDDFERLVNMICQKILGTGVIEFAKGKDEGKDGCFTGKAENFPSLEDNWTGKFIIQAKHSSNPIASCSDKDFQYQISKVEIPKLQKLKARYEIDNYLLFTNRKYTGLKGTELVRKIKQKTEIDNIEIIGKETINRYLSQNKAIRDIFDLDKYILPFEFTDSDLKDLVISFKEEVENSNPELKEGLGNIASDLRFIEKDIKNEKNNVSKKFFDNVIKEYSLKYFAQIDEFLQNPINDELSETYRDLTMELNSLITIKRDDFLAFEEIFVFLYNYVKNRNEDLKKKKRFISIFLHYMYFNCDIGIK